jgi:hypothetical protein
MVIGLTGYTNLTFDATVQAAFVEAIATLGGFETARVEVTTVTDSSTEPPRAQTVRGNEGCWNTIAVRGDSAVIYCK